jgi:hypothetical protein
MIEESDELHALRQRYLIKMQALQSRKGVVSTHEAADDVLCQLLIELGYTDIVIEFVKLDKWYHYQLEDSIEVEGEEDDNLDTI